MNIKNVKVIDEHNIDRNANIMFAVDLNGSEYVVYWIERDETSNNVFVSKVLKNIDGTYNMLNIDDSDKKREVSEVVKFLVSAAVTDQNDKMTGLSKTLSNGEVAKFVNVSFNKEQNINVPKTYITTVKKEVTKVVEEYYDVVSNELQVENVLTPVSDVLSPSTVMPEVVETITNVETPVVEEVKVVEPVVAPVVATPVVPTPVESVLPVQEVKVETVVTPAVAPVSETVVTPVAATIPTPVVQPQPEVVVAPVLEQPVLQPVVETPVVPTPVVSESIMNTTQTVAQPLVFNAAKETNLNAALGEVANSNNIPVQNINVVREFGEETPAAQTIVQPAVAPMVQSAVASESNMLDKKAGFANSKFFMVVAIGFFMASCIFLGYEVFNYFQLTSK